MYWAGNLSVNASSHSYFSSGNFSSEPSAAKGRTNERKVISPEGTGVANPVSWGSCLISVSGDESALLGKEFWVEDGALRGGCLGVFDKKAIDTLL